MRKRCTRCKQLKSLDEFCIMQSRPDGRDYTCRGCRKDYYDRHKSTYSQKRKTRRAREPRRRRPMTSNYYLRKYGITLQERDKLIARQGGKCAICKNDLVPSGNHTCVDHDHETRVVRGILCRTCNSGIGQFNDDPVLLHVALEYLARSKIRKV